MDNLINAILTHYVPTAIIISFVIGIFVVAIAGILRNSGRHDDIARSNLIIQTVIVGFIMLFVSGAFVFAFHQTYVSRFYGSVQDSVTSKLPAASDINNTDLLGNEIKDTQLSSPDARCILVVVDTIDCVKKTINDIIGSLIEKLVRGIGVVVGKIVDKFNFNFLFNLPVEVFDAGPNPPADKLARVVNFNNLIKVSEIIGLAWVYLLIVTHYFKAIIFSLDNDYSNDFIGDIGKMLLGFAGVFLAKFAAEEAGTTYLLLTGLVLPDGCSPATMDALLCPTPRDGYSSRLFFAEKINFPLLQQPNWNADGLRILERDWYALSWKVNREDLRLAQMVANHVKPHP